MATEIRSTSKLLDAYEKSRAKLKRIQEQSDVVVQRGVSLAVGCVGGAASGAARGLGYPKIPRTQIDTDLALGGAAAIGGLLGIGGKQSDTLMIFGLCMAAPALSRLTEEALRKK